MSERSSLLWFEYYFGFALGRLVPKVAVVSDHETSVNGGLVRHAGLVEGTVVTMAGALNSSESS